MIIENVIVRHEIARQKVADLERKKRSLISDCDNMKQGNDHSNWKLKEPCLVVAWRWLRSENKGESYCNQIGYDEMISNSEDFDIGTASGRVCGNCMEAYKIKRGDLAEAKKEFGAAKRSLSAVGKKIIKESR